MLFLKNQNELKMKQQCNKTNDCKCQDCWAKEYHAMIDLYGPKVRQQYDRYLLCLSLANKMIGCHGQS